MNKSRVLLFVLLSVCAVSIPTISVNAAGGDTYCGCEEHIHSIANGCYEVKSHSDCGLAEHIHSENCYDVHYEQICSFDDSDETHTHDESCYAEVKNLICSLPEHTHSDACNAFTETILICTRSEHNHTELCYSNPEDTEIQAEWEDSLSAVELTKDWQKDLLAVAESQLGYHGKESNFILDSSGRKKLYTRYGAWYHDPYGDWCAMFVSFCLHYAGVGEQYFPKAGGCCRWQLTLDEMGLYLPKTVGDEVFIPKPGDIIFFGNEKTGEASHVGIVSALLYEDEDDPSQVTGVETIEGNHGFCVARFTYSISDKWIVGYGLLPENPGPDYFINEDGSVTFFATTASGVKITLIGKRAAFPYLLDELTLEVSELCTISPNGTEMPCNPRRFDVWVSHDGQYVPLLDEVAVAVSAEEGQIRMKKASGAETELEAMTYMN